MRDMEEEPRDLYADAVINNQQVNAVQGDALFAEMKI